MRFLGVAVVVGTIGCGQIAPGAASRPAPPPRFDYTPPSYSPGYSPGYTSPSPAPASTHNPFKVEPSKPDQYHPDCRTAPMGQGGGCRY